MSTRRVVLTGLGLLGAAAIAMVAAQLFSVGLGWSPPLPSDAVGNATDQVRNIPQPGVAMIVGIALVLIALVLAVLWVVDLVGPRRPTVSMRRQGGATKVDRPSLEASLERELNRIDVRTTVDVAVRRRGRAVVVVHTADPSRTGPSRQVADRMQELVDHRHLPIAVKRLTVAPATGKAKRRRVA